MSSERFSGPDRAPRLEDVAGTSFETVLEAPGRYPVHFTYIGSAHTVPVSEAQFAAANPSAYALELVSPQRISEASMRAMFGAEAETPLTEVGADTASILQHAKRTGQPVFHMDVALSPRMLREETDDYVDGMAYGKAMSPYFYAVAVLTGLGGLAKVGQEAIAPIMTSHRRSVLKGFAFGMLGTSGAAAGLGWLSELPYNIAVKDIQTIERLVADGSQDEVARLDMSGPIRRVSEWSRARQAEYFFGRENLLLTFRNLVMARHIHAAVKELGREEGERLLAVAGSRHFELDRVLAFPSDELDQAIGDFMRILRDQLTSEEFRMLHESIVTLRKMTWVGDGEEAHWKYESFPLRGLPGLGT